MKPKNILIIVILLTVMLMSAACKAAHDADDEVIGMANPASVNCEEQGGTLEIRTSKDGSQHGVCVYDDGSECDEWAFFHEECSPGEHFPTNGADESPPVEEQTTALDRQSVLVTALYGSVVSSSEKGPSDSLLVLTSEGFLPIFVTGESDDIESMIQQMKDKNEPANKANFWGILDCTSADQCLLTVTRMRLDGPGAEEPGDKVEGWEGVIYSGPPGPRSGGEDYFTLLGVVPLEYGIWSMDDSLNQQLEELRDSGQDVRIWGELHTGRMDWNATQIVVTRIELIDVDTSQIPPAPNW